MWSRVYNINDITELLDEKCVRVTYHPYHFACPIIAISFYIYLDGSIVMYLSLAGFANLDGLQSIFASKPGRKFHQSKSDITQGRILSLRDFEPEDIDWLIKLMVFINQKFSRNFFDSTFITEIKNMIAWLQDETPNKPAYEHLISEAKRPTNCHINPSLANSTDLARRIGGIQSDNAQETRNKLFAALRHGEDPNQPCGHNSGNVLDSLLRGAYSYNRMNMVPSKELENVLLDITIACLCYGLDPFRRANAANFSTLENAATAKFWSIYDVIIKSITRLRPSLKLKNENIDYIDEDKIRIHTLLPFPDMQIRTCLMPTKYLQQDEIIALFGVFSNLFSGINDSEKNNIRDIFCNDLMEGNKNIEIIYHENKIIGYLLTYFDANHQSDDTIYHCDYALFDKKYQKLGLAGFLIDRLGLAKKFALGNSDTKKYHRVLFHAEIVSEGSYHLIKHHLHFPKYQTPEMSRDVKEFTYKIFGDQCLYIQRDSSCYVKDNVIVDANNNHAREFNIFDYFFNHFLRDLPHDSKVRINELNRSVPVRICVGAKYFQHWVEQAQKMGVNGYNELPIFTRLLQQTIWGKSCKVTRALSYAGAFQKDEEAFFLNQRIPTTIENQPIMPACSRI